MTPDVIARIPAGQMAAYSEDAKLTWGVALERINRVRRQKGLPEIQPRKK